jgi:hypothetical protein
MDGDGAPAAPPSVEQFAELQSRNWALEKEVELMKDILAKFNAVGNDTASTSNVETSVKEENCEGGSSTSCDMLSEGKEMVAIDESVAVFEEGKAEATSAEGKEVVATSFGIESERKDTDCELVSSVFVFEEEGEDAKSMSAEGVKGAGVGAGAVGGDTDSRSLRSFDSVLSSDYVDLDAKSEKMRILALKIFNKNPKKGIKLLIERVLSPNDAPTVAEVGGIIRRVSFFDENWRCIKFSGE